MLDSFRNELLQQSVASEVDSSMPRPQRARVLKYLLVRHEHMTHRKQLVRDFRNEFSTIVASDFDGSVRRRQAREALNHLLVRHEDEPRGTNSFRNESNIDTFHRSRGGPRR
jgi:hypothetical protein